MKRKNVHQLACLLYRVNFWNKINKKTQGVLGVKKQTKCYDGAGKTHPSDLKCLTRTFRLTI